MALLSQSDQQYSETLFRDVSEYQNTSLFTFKMQKESYSALFNTVCVMAGLGILQLPFTFKQGGWITQIILLIMAIMTNYTAKILMISLYNGKYRIDNYAKLGEVAFGKIGLYTVHIFQKATLFGVAVLFLILADKFLDESIEESNYWILICSVVMIIPLTFYKDLEEMALLNLLGASATVLVMMTIIFFGFYTTKGETQGNHSFIEINGLATAFSSIVVSYGGHANMPSIEQAMKKKSDYIAVINWTFVILYMIYMPTATVGYYLYGQNTYSPILCNLPRDGWLNVFTKMFITFHILTVFPIMLNCLVVELEDSYEIQKNGFTNNYYFIRSIHRISWIIITAATAQYIPYFADVMTLVGGLCMTFVGFIMPVLIYQKLKWKSLSQKEIAFGWITVMSGVAGGAIGSIQALQALIQKVQSGANPENG